MSYDRQVLGTIISSMLNYDQLCTAIGEPATVTPEKSTYAPCDGRAITGSALHKLAGLKEAPDGRGKFLRGLNSFYSPGEPGVVANGDPDGSGRTAGSYQEDIFASHSHGYVLSNIFTNADGGDNRSYRGADSPGVLTSATGGAETRPRNIAVYYYIRIN